MSSKWRQIRENLVKVASDTSKCHQNDVGYTSIVVLRMPPVAIMHVFATFFEVQLGGHGADKSGKERTTGRSGRKPSPKQALSEAFRRRKSEMFL